MYTEPEVSKVDWRLTAVKFTDVVRTTSENISVSNPLSKSISSKLVSSGADMSGVKPSTLKHWSLLVPAIALFTTSLIASGMKVR